MKKFTAIFFVSLIICFCAMNSYCKKEEGLETYVSEARTLSYVGSSDDFTLKANYGYKENPFEKDGKVGEKVYALTFKLDGISLSPSTYYLSFDYNETQYKDKFTLSASNGYSVSFEINDFSSKEFEVNIICGSTLQNIKLTSIVPENTLSYTEALNKLKESQSELIGVYYEAEEFNAEIYARILVKEDKPYWYIAFATKDDLKALLVDGFTGEVLAIRNVF